MQWMRDRRRANVADGLGLDRSRWAHGWRRAVFPSVFMVYLLQTVAGVVDHTDGLGTLAGLLVLALFCFSYLKSMLAGWDEQHDAFRRYYVAMLVLVPIEALFAHEDAFIMLVYVGVMTIAAWFGRAVPVLVLFMVISVAVPPLIKPWHAKLDVATALAILTVALAMFGFFGIIRSNRALEEARLEVARLAAENERTRIARDLHDLLGHSLTTITVKAGLAHRIAARDPERAAAEIAEVEQLSRQTLADVRAAVSGYREVTLANELAAAHEVLRAAGINSRLPGAVDSISEDDSALFGWVVREGVTNVVRHSRAENCLISIGDRSIEISDDGVASSGSVVSGNGLAGLRERVERAGGSLSVGSNPDGRAGGCSCGRWRRDQVAARRRPGARPVWSCSTAFAATGLRSRRRGGTRRRGGGRGARVVA